MPIDRDKNTQILVTMPWELKEEIEEYQHKEMISSRTSAILDLIEKGLENSKNEESTE